MREGRRRAGPDLVVFYSEPGPEGSEKRFKNKDLDSLGGSRIGITASRKVGNAVRRNRFKRRVRSWFRHRRGDVAQALGLEAVDLVVIARRSGAELGLAELDERLSRLLGLPQNSCRDA